MAAPHIFDLAHEAIPPHFNLQWHDLTMLLKSGLNLRFCTTLDVAKDILRDGTKGDYLPFMGGFSSVAATACPKNAQHAEQQKLGAAMGVSKKGVNNRIDIYVEGYVLGRSQANWNKLSNTLETQFPCKDPALTFTAVEKQAICANVQAELLHFFTAFSRGPTAVVVFLKAFDTFNYDQDNAYGLFGKAGAKRLEPRDFNDTIMVAVGAANDRNVNVAEQLLWGYVQRATAHAATLGW